MSAVENSKTVLLVIQRLAKWSMVGLAGVAVAAGGVWGLSVAYEKYQNRPYSATSYEQVSIGDSKDQVIYVLGIPTAVLVPPKPIAGNPWSNYAEIVSLEKIPEGKSFKEYSDWMYEFTSGGERSVEVGFSGKAGIVSVSCFSKSVYNCQSLFGLRVGSTEEEVLQQLGKPEQESIEDTVKTMHYPKFNFMLFLEKKRVYMIKLVRPTGV